MNAVKRLALGWASAMLAIGAAAPAPAQVPAQRQGAQTGPSFSCTSARTAVEKAICDDPALAAADREMASLFILSRQSAFGTGASNELEAQRLFLQETRACGKSAPAWPIPKCLAAAYGRRNGELAISVLMRAPDQALPVLKRLTPGFAPILEAVALWAREPVNADWSAPERAPSRKRIVMLLTPYLTVLQTNEDQSFGYSILSNPAGDEIAVTRIDDIFRSDRHFAALLDVLGPYLPEENGPANGAIGAVLPCAAIVRHPALLGATAAPFGSTMDNFVLNSDCERTLPPLPLLTALDRKINKSWPECEGTIRFSAYRAYRNALDAARLGQVSRKTGSDVSSPQGITAAEVTAVRSELARHYAAYLGKSTAQAGEMARLASAAMLSAAHGCGT